MSARSVTSLTSYNKWIVELDNIKINEIHPKVQCEILMAVEESLNFTKIINMIEFYSGIITRGKVIIISSSEINNMVRNYDTIRQPYWEDEFVEIIYSSCSEAEVYLKMGNPIPVDLLAKLIKLKIISTIKGIVFLQQKEATMMQQKDYFKPPPADEESSKKKGKKKGKADKKSKSSKSGKKGKKDKTAVVIDPCANFKYEPLDEIAPEKGIEISNNFVYIVLVGFHVPSLMQFCDLNGMPLKCIVRFGDETKYNKNNKFASIASINCRDENIAMSAGKIYLPTSILIKQKEEMLLQFWRKINMMYKQENSSYLNNSCIMIYRPLLFVIAKTKSKLYFHQCEQLYEDFSKFVEKLETYQRQYNSYLDSMRVYNLDIKPKKVEAHEMQIYRDGLDALPIDIINVSLILDYIIKEICKEEDRNRTSAINKLKMNKENVKKQSYHLDQEDIKCHRSLRDQLKKIFRHFKTTYSTCLLKPLTCYNSLGLNINMKPYIVHEANFIEMNLNYYKFLPESVLETLTAYLKKYNFISIFSNLPPLKDTTESANKQEVRKLCSLLGTEETDLSIAVSAILIGMFLSPNATNISRESLFSNEIIPAQKAVHEIQASIQKKDNRKIMHCMDQANPYERIKPFDLKWVDALSPIVALQELAEASQKFELMDWRYVELFDSVLYRFHHDVDDFGITTKFWKQSIRTPVNFHDFMTYVAQTDLDTVAEQNEQYRAEEELCKLVKGTVESVSDFNPQSDDFILPESLRYKFLHQEQVGVLEPKAGKGKKGKKEKSQKSKKTKSDSKSKGKSSKKTKDANAFDARGIVNDEPLKGDIENYECTMTLLKEEDPPPQIDAVDFNGLLLTGSGISTSFYSLDDLRINVEQSQICDKETKLSIKIGLNGHDLIVHRTSKNDFSFLVNFKSGVVLACGRPNTNQSNVDRNFYLISEESEKLVSCMRSLFNARKHVIVTNDNLQKVIRCSKMQKKSEEKMIDEKSTISQKPVMKNSRILATLGVGNEPKRKTRHNTLTKNKTSSVVLLNRRKSINEKNAIEASNFSIKGFVSEVKLLKQIFDTTIPKFKVCSSKLHKYDFIKRVTSPIELNLNEVIRFVMRAKREHKRHLTVKKRYNIKIENKNYKSPYEYDFRLTLPSGLHLRNITGNNGTYICQYYFQKHAVLSPICDEDCRFFLGNGTVAVKKDDGKFIIYDANGEIIKYETTLAESSHDDHIFYKNTNSSAAMPKFLKHVRRNIYKLTKGNHQSENITSTRRLSKKQIRRFHCQKRKQSLSDITFTITTSEGKNIRYKNGVLTEREKYYVEREDALKTGQVIFRREDGTTSVLTDEGHMQTIFPDNTKITVWCEVDLKSISIDLTDIFGPDCDMGSFVNIVTCYQYEHPHYITVLSNGSDEKLMLRITSGEIFDISSKHFLVGIDEWSTLLANEEIIRIVGTPCDECSRYCECDVYIKQLYDPPPVVDEHELFLKASDTYNKSFILHYDGSIERNEEYIKEKKRCGHVSHKIQSPQAFFSLNRDFSGNRFWTDDDYNKRLSEATDPETNYLVFYVNKEDDKILTTEWKIFEKQHYNFRFVWPETRNSYNDEVDEYDISKAAFVKQRIIKRVPSNVIHNLIHYIKNDSTFSSSFSNLYDMNYVSCTTLPSTVPTETDKSSGAVNVDAKMGYEKRMNKRNGECMDVVDKIIEYFVKKTGRYYRSKIYEDFCGIKLMLDDEEEIYFLANFDSNSHATSSSSEVASSSAEDLNKTQNLSPLSELMKSKLSKSTSAVETAVEVIKQLEMEKQNGKHNTIVGLWELL